jgi:hypothetical protein
MHAYAAFFPPHTQPAHYCCLVSICRSEKKILGIMVDRTMLQRIFGASAAVAYLILKETADKMIAQAQSFAPPGFPMIAVPLFSDSDASESYECMLTESQQALIEATAALNATCVYNITVGPGGIRDWFQGIQVSGPGSPEQRALDAAAAEDAEAAAAEEEDDGGLADVLGR